MCLTRGVLQDNNELMVRCAVAPFFKMLNSYRCKQENLELPGSHCLRNYGIRWQSPSGNGERINRMGELRALALLREPWY